MPAPSVPVLAYDELPHGSDLRRVYGPQGLTITVPAGEPVARSLRAASQAAMLRAAGMATAILLLGVGIVRAAVDTSRLDASSRTAAVIAFAVLCAALFLFAWRFQFLAARDALRNALRQATVLHVTPARLLIETLGPQGAASHDVTADQIRQLSIHRVPADLRALSGVRIPVLRLALQDQIIDLAPGREQSELRWMLNAITHALAKPPPTPRPA